MRECTIAGGPQSRPRRIMGSRRSSPTLEWIKHDEIDRIVVPTRPLRIYSADPVDTVLNPKLGQHSRPRTPLRGP